jgi:uncharacterized repeat protein (TIGR02543 family)
MKTRLDLRRRYCFKRIGIFFTVVALVAGIAACDGVAKYNLTMVANPAAGGTAVDETNESPYPAGSAISIKAEARAGYRFAGWTATSGGFGDTSVEETTFTMPAQAATITANFEEIETYVLTMAAHPVEGGTATDETDGSPYAEGSVISIRAEVNAGYQFAGWKASAGVFADPSAAETTFTMPAGDITVTAYFVVTGTFDHATVYVLDPWTSSYIGETVYLEDQFCAVEAIVEAAAAVTIPAEKVHGGTTTPILNHDHCLTVYVISYEEEPGEWSVEIRNQFGTQNLTVQGPIGLAVPTQNEGHEAPMGLDHYLLYGVIDYTYLEEATAELDDQFLDEPLFSGVYEPGILASPARKTVGDQVTGILNPDAHAVLYMTDEGDVSETLEVINQFGEQTLQVFGPIGLVVPSEVTQLEPPEPPEPPEHPLAVAAVLGDYEHQLTYLLWANNIRAEERNWDVIADIGDYDVVVVNQPDDPGSTDFQAFLDAASDSGVGVVFTSSYPADSSWGISLLEWYFGGPGGQSEDYHEGDVYYKVTQEHPILDGWDVGDEITIITGGDCDHVWFWDYSGDTIAEVGSVGGGIQGDAVAVGTYGGSTHVLLASLGPQSDTDVTAWTNDGRAVFINAVCFAAGI